MSSQFESARRQWVLPLLDPIVFEKLDAEDKTFVLAVMHVEERQALLEALKAAKF
jgi:hypothetical protein